MKNRIKYEGNREGVSVIRQYSTIRYDKKLNKRIDEVLTKYNNKIIRLEKQGSRYILPQKVSKQDLMEISWTRRDIQRRLDNIEKFTKRGAEKSVLMDSGYAISKYELDYLKQEKSRVKRIVKKDIAFYENVKPKLFGKETARTFAQMGDTQYLNALARYEAIDKDISELPIDELFAYRRLLESAGKDRDYLATSFQLNYMDILTDVGYYVGYDEEKIKKIKEELMKIDPHKFYDLYINEKSIKDVVEYYYPTRDGKKDPKNFKKNVSDLYDNLISNMEDIVKDYI